MLGTPGPFFVLTTHELESDPYKNCIFPFPQPSGLWKQVWFALVS